MGMFNFASPAAGDPVRKYRQRKFWVVVGGGVAALYVHWDCYSKSEVLSLAQREFPNVDLEIIKVHEVKPRRRARRAKGER